MTDDKSQMTDQWLREVTLHREICHLLSAICYSRSARNTRFEWSSLFYINGSSDLTSFRRGSSRMFTDLSIRPVTRQDYAQWLPLWDGYNAFYGRSGPTALPAEITQITWARFFDAYEPIYALVAQTNGQLIGLAHYLFHRSTITIAPTCYLQDLFTSQPARGKGVGKALIKGVYDQAKNTGSGVYWHTHETNKTARRLYDQVAENPGFIVYRNHEWTQIQTPTANGHE
jgi:GNAT superfamily N-acetyltransferase